jgi:hypothetical protein
MVLSRPALTDGVLDLAIIAGLIILNAWDFFNEKINLSEIVYF